MNVKGLGRVEETQYKKQRIVEIQSKPWKVCRDAQSTVVVNA